MSGRKFTDDEQADIHALYTADIPAAIRTISAAYRVHDRTIKTVLQKSGVAIRPRGANKRQGSNKTSVERFWEKVDKTDSCWVWTAAMSTYGPIFIAPDMPTASGRRLAYILIHGPIPKSFYVINKCKNILCVRPDHCELAAVSEVQRLRGVKGAASKHERSFAPGEKHIHAKLSLAQVRRIRQRYQPGKVTLNDLAKRYGVTKAQICHILKGRSWKGLGFDPVQSED